MEERQMDYWKDMENTNENSENIGKTWEKIVKWIRKYGRKASRIVKRFGKHKTLWQDRENMEEW